MDIKWMEISCEFCHTSIVFWSSDQHFFWRALLIKCAYWRFLGTLTTDRMCDCFDASRMQRPQLDRWHLWCHTVRNSMRSTRPTTNHCQNGQPGYHLSRPSSCQRASPACRPMDGPASSYFGRSLSRTYSRRLCSRLCRWRFPFWHNLCCRFRRIVWCRRPLCLHRTASLVMSVIGVSGG